MPPKPSNTFWRGMMPRFFVRVELPDSPKADYDDLHEKMKAARYYRSIDSNKGRRQLPHATYTCSADTWTSAQVLDEAYGIARSVHKDPRVLAIESAGWTSRGLLPL
jgi:hypothetical protein